ncbi:MAG: hypothetical protein KGJ98_03370 [Chloroflexota bacterium]|nr:hypothetical protein [Chloroflexota bacterium]MDE3101253.1 hypothetical protein [Chloroflexota bacterium]
MIGKLLSLLSTAKGAAVVVVIAAAGVGTGVVATNTDLQNALGSAMQNVTGASPSAKASPEASGRPAVVAARNDADKKLRDAFQKDQQTLEKLRGTKVAPADRSKLEDTIKTADDALRTRLDKALNDVAALTLGREGLVNGAGKPSGSPAATPTGTPTATPTATATATTSVSASATPKALASFTPAQQAQVDAIVSAAIGDMDKIAADAETAVAALPTMNPGKPGGQPGAKPSGAGKPSGQPGAKPSDAGKPSSHP